VRSLQRKELIEREVDAADTRARRLHVTKRGAEIAVRAIAIVEDVDSAFFADVPERQSLSFLRRLAQLPQRGEIEAAGRSPQSTDRRARTRRGRRT
jgi:DNA-binding MarR family transcriptional regulator